MAWHGQASRRQPAAATAWDKHHPMNQPDMIVGIISILACLFLVTNGSRFRGMSAGNRVQLALFWLVVIAVLAFAAQKLGLHTN
jgi:hypothetical protein